MPAQRGKEKAINKVVVYLTDTLLEKLDSASHHSGKQRSRYLFDLIEAQMEKETGNGKADMREVRSGDQGRVLL